jgi:dihydroxynaphthoic acid synthetase
MRVFREITYQKKVQGELGASAWITIQRPEKLNACTPRTVAELIEAFLMAWVDEEVGVVVFTGAGDRAFCVGGDQSVRERGGYKGEKEGSFLERLPLEVGWQWVTQLIRYIPKPVIARVNGYAIGGGHVWQMVCDLTIASENAEFGQAGPRVGSFDPGFGTGDLVRNVGLKRAKEIWFLCRRYTAREAERLGLVNWVVPKEKLDEELERIIVELLEKSPTALKMLKHAFYADLDGTSGITQLGVSALSLYYRTDEAMEGRNAFMEKRKPSFGRFRRNS